MIIGMDFGTTNSGMAAFDGQQLRLIPLDPANRNPYVARTALYITNDKTIHLGRGATDTYYEQNLNRPFKLELVRVGEIELTFAEVGTFIRDVYIERDIYSPGRLFLSFKMGLSSPDYVGTVVGKEYYFLENIIAIYLYMTRKRAEAFLEREVDTIVLGRPVRFSDDHEQDELARERLLQAAFMAGYKRVYLQYEPIAAAHYYETSIDHEQNVLIFDFGGGTLDISVLRVGNPKTRRVLATGGIAIAGDVFDRKIARRTLPQHFGEGTTYRHNGQDLPLPSSYFEAFGDWQALLNLQLPDQLEALKRIQHTARYPHKINALINLITSSYALKMYDLVEAGKRQLSEHEVTTLMLDGPGFAIRQLLTRADFERIIRADIRAIGECLDAVIQEAGLRPDQIDAVIRTGGSSQIPAFIGMLESRFRPEIVRDIDAFSSVTSGLGVLAHQIGQGEVDLKCYTPDRAAGGDYLNITEQGGIPVINLNTMKKLIDIKEAQTEQDTAQLLLVCQDNQQQITATRYDPQPVIQQAGIHMPATLASAADEFLLVTTEYRTLLKQANQLADLQMMGLKLETIESFHQDAFGKETVCALVAMDTLRPDDAILLISSSGYVKKFIGETLLEKLSQPVPYTFDRLRGNPAHLISAGNSDDLLLFTSSGRALRLHPRQIAMQPERLIKVTGAVTVVAAFAMWEAQDIIVATSSGYGQFVNPADIPLGEPGGSGEKIISRSNIICALPHQPQTALWAITSNRVIQIDPAMLKRDAETHLLTLKRGEDLLSLVYV